MSYRSKFKCRSLTSGSDFYQQTTAKNLQGTRLVDVEILAHGLKECSFCKRGKFEFFFTTIIASDACQFIFLILLFTSTNKE